MMDAPIDDLPLSSTHAAVPIKRSFATLNGLLNRLRYVNDDGNRFRKYIWRYLLRTVARGFYYRAFRLTSRGVISVGDHVLIEGPKSNLVFGNHCKIERNVVIQAISRSTLRFGDDVTICEGTMIRPSGHWGGNLGGGVVMGNRSSIGAYSYIGCAGSIEIGDDVMMGPRITIIAENHNFADVTRPMHEQGVNNRGVTLGNDIWVGTGVTILDGVTVGDHSIIAAGSVVTKDVQPFAIVAGVPARQLRSRKACETAPCTPAIMAEASEI
jgi:acetyltransferase-like isoleucine patch superfamily enzyme